MFFRHAQLVLVNLAEHPEAKNEENRAALAAAEKEVKGGIEKMEVLRPRINKRYEAYAKLTRERQAQQPSSFRDRRDSAAADHVLAQVAKPLEAGENRELAVQLARDEMGRRATARRATRERDQHRVRGTWDGEQPREEQDDLSKRIQDVRRNMEEDGRMRESRVQSSSALKDASVSSSAYKYPSVPRLNPLDASSLLAAYNGTGESGPAPNLPAKEHFLPGTNAEMPSPSLLPPPLSQKQLPSSPASPPPLPPRPEKGTPPGEKDPGKMPNRSHRNLDPASYTFRPSACLENGTPLRTVFISSNLRRTFVSVAAYNTSSNLETCGILCGTLVSNALFVSKLLIPEQKATSDTCETTDEAAIFEYCESEDLIVLGWIHTHPTQTCFMSSRDLHTHCGYQVMLPESIAIVCAPSKVPDWGVFRLTDPPGLRTVLNCTQTGLFHPHSATNIYTDALKPGHVYEVKDLEFETVDLRRNAHRT